MRSSLSLTCRIAATVAAGVTLTGCFTYRSASLGELAPGDHIRLESARGVRYGPATAAGAVPECGARRLEGIVGKPSTSQLGMRRLDAVTGADSAFCATWKGSAVTVSVADSSVRTARRRFSRGRTIGMIAGTIVLMSFVLAAAAASATAGFLAGPS